MTEPVRTTTRRGPDPVALVTGVLALVVAACAVTGFVPVLPGFDPRWLIAGVVAVLGVLLLVGSARKR